MAIEGVGVMNTVIGTGVVALAVFVIVFVLCLCFFVVVLSEDTAQEPVAVTVTVTLAPLETVVLLVVPICGHLGNKSLDSVELFISSPL